MPEKKVSKSSETINNELSIRINRIDEAAKITSPIIAAADGLLALRLQSLGVRDFPGLVLPALPDPVSEMERQYQQLSEEVEELLAKNQLSQEELEWLLQLKHQDQRTQDLWHVYTFGIYTLTLILERYGQELGRERGVATVGLRQHLAELFEGRPFHTLQSFVFMATPNLELETSVAKYYLSHAGVWHEHPHNPFEITGDGQTRRAPTSIDVSPFIDLLVKGELAGYRVNECLLAVIGSVRQQVYSAEVRAWLTETVSLWHTIRRGYAEYNRSGFTPQAFALALRQFTVNFGYPPSERVARGLGIDLDVDQKALIDHFLFSFNQPLADQRIRETLVNDLAYLPRITPEKLELSKLQEAFADPDNKVGAKVMLLKVLQSLGIDGDDAMIEKLAGEIVESDHQQVPSGSISAVHAVCDIFFGVEAAIPAYWTHLLNRYPAMTSLDRRFIDQIWQVQKLLPPGFGNWYLYLISFYRNDGEIISLLDQLLVEFRAMTLAHAGVMNRFVKNPAKSAEYGAGSVLISNLASGTTGMTFSGILGQLEDFRLGLAPH